MLTFSLVIPLQDEEATVDTLLASIAAQTRAPDEVIVVDAGSKDSTMARVRAFPLRIPTTTVSAGRVFPGVARNAGVGVSQNDWVAFTDGGIRLESAWLEELERVAGTGVDAVIGRWDPSCRSLFEQFAAIAYIPAVDRHGTRGPGAASLAVKRSAFLRVGGFPAYRAAEDLVLIERLRAGGNVGHAARAVVHWDMPATARATFRRFASYSYHNLAARRGRHWHLGVARLYLALLAMMALAAALGGVTIAAAIPPAFFLSRAFKAAWTKRDSLPFVTLHPIRVPGAALVLLAVDIATFVGTIHWLFASVRSRAARSPHVASSTRGRVDAPESKRNAR